LQVATQARPAAELTSAWVARVPNRGGQKGALQITRAPECSSPAYAERGLFACVFSGLLHNRKELSTTLAHGERASDADLILRAYEKWGRDCPEHVRGMFAFVVWDSPREVVFGARDRIGVHPLFWTFVRDTLLTSPSISALLSDPNVSREFNRPGIVDHLRHTWGDHPSETFYAAISRLPAGHAFEAAHGRLRAWPYWKLLELGRQVEMMSEAEAEGFDDMLDRAVERCIDLGSTGIFLSGGLDSVSVAASAIELTRVRGCPPPLALSLGFPHPECNEESVQRGVASGLGIRQVLLPVGQTVEPEGLLWSGLMMDGELDAPLSNIWAPAYFRLRLEAQRSGCEVIMTGNGGDDWLCVDSLYFADLLRAVNVREVIRMTANQLRSFEKSPTAMLRRLLWGYGLRPLLALQAQRVLKRVAPGVLQAHRRRGRNRITPPWLAPDPDLQKESQRRFEEVDKALASRPEPRGKFGFFFSEAPLALIRPLQAMEFEEAFALSRRTGPLELAPYWDADLVEFMNRIPPGALEKGGRSKALVRASVAKRFPGLGFDRQRKVSAFNFFKAVLESEGPGAWKRLNGAPTLAEMGIVGLGPDVPGCFGAQASSQVDRIIRMHRVLEVMHVEAWARARSRGVGTHTGRNHAEQ
jgi:asparagine synthase (glutamine-hydrolysing)